MNRNVAKAVYLIGSYLRSEPIIPVLRELEESQWYSLSKIRELQWVKLKKLLMHAYTNVRYYKAMFDQNGIHPNDIKNREDFSRIPILSKNQLRNNLEKMVARRNSKKMRKAKTSGTSGQPLIFCKDPVTCAYHRAPLFRGHRWYGVELGAVEARLMGVPIDLKHRYPEIFFDYFLNRFREKEFNLAEETLHGFYTKMRIKKPEYLKGYPSMLYEFANFLQDKGLDGKRFRLKLIECTAETLYDYQKKIIEGNFNSKVVSQYGSAETGVISFECPEGGHHVNADCIYEEYLDFEPPMARSRHREMVVTDLHNYMMPLIRFNLGDRVIPNNKQCSCGRGLPTLSRVEGRTCDFVVGSNDKKFHSIIFHYIMEDLLQKGGGVKQFKAFQNRQAEVKFQIVKNKNFSNRATNYITKKMKEYLGDQTKVKFEFVYKIDREPSGKLRDFVSNLP